MKKKGFDWPQIQSLAEPFKNISTLSDLSVLLILACSPYYNDRWLWSTEGEISDADWNDISAAIGQMENEIMVGLIGAIIPHFMADISGLNVLPCEGQTLLRVDYPLLYDAIDTAFHIDPDTFFLPDMRGNMIVGADATNLVGTTGGEKEVTLDMTMIPSHNHTTQPHAHTESTASPTVGAAITGVPVPSAFPSVNLTSFETVVVDNVGGGQPHNNMPPFVAVNWFIVSG